MANEVIDIRVVASTSSAEQELKKFGTTAEQELGAGGKLGKASKGGETAMKDVEKESGLLGGSMEKGKKGVFSLIEGFTGLNPELLVGAAALAGFGEVGKEVFDEWNKLHDATVTLDRAMKDAGERSTPEFRKALDEAQKSGEALGFEASDTTKALADMTEAGLTQKQALAQLPVIMDLARAKGMDLATATLVVTKGVAGSARALKEFGVATLVTLPTISSQESGLQTLKMAQEAVAAATEKHTKAVKKYGAESPQAAAAAAALAKANETLSYDQNRQNTILNTAWVKAHNLTVIHDALAHKVGGQARAATHDLGVQWDILKAKFNDFAGQAVPVVLNALQQVGLFLTKVAEFIITYVVPVIVKIGSVMVSIIKFAVGVWITEISILIHIIQGVVSVVVTVVTKVGQVLGGITSAFKAVFGGIAGIISGVANGIATAVKGIINTVIGVLNFFIGVIDTVIGGMNAVLGKIPTFGLGKIQIGLIGKIPQLASGGIVMPTPGGSLVNVAEGGRPEAIIPLPSNFQAGGRGARGGDTYDVDVNVQANADPNAISRAVVWGLRTRARTV